MKKKSRLNLEHNKKSTPCSQELGDNIWGNSDLQKIPTDFILQLKSLTNISLPGKHVTVFLAVTPNFLSAVRSFVYVFWPMSVLIKVRTESSAGSF